MNKLWLFAGVLGACAANQPSTPLAQLEAKFGAPTIDVVANAGQVNILLHVNEVTSCPLLGDDVVAKFDGQLMDVSRGGHDTNSTGCFPIGFWFNSVPTEAAVGFESITKASQLEVSDKSATWNIQTSKLLSNDFTIDNANSTITWSDVSTITSAQIQPGGALGINGNVISFPQGTQVQWVGAFAHPAATLCSGPSLCEVDLQGSRTWTPTPQ